MLASVERVTTHPRTPSWGLPFPHTWLLLPTVGPAQGGPCAVPTTLPCPHHLWGEVGGGAGEGPGSSCPPLGCPGKGAAPPLPLLHSSLGVLVPHSPSPASQSPFLAVWSLSWQPSRPQGCISAAIGLNLFSHFPVECVSWVPGSNEQEEWAGLGVPPASGLSLACRPWGPLLCRRRAPGSAPPCHRLCFSA